MVDGQDDPSVVSDSIITGDAAPTPAATSPLDPKLARRRLLLKSIAAGVPAVITLQSSLSASAAATSMANCIARDNIQTLTSYGGSRCMNSTAAGTNSLKTLAYNDSHWSGTGPCTASQYGVVYVDASGVVPTTANYGGNGTPTAAPVSGTSGYYAITKSCWGSFH
ncbi:MAG: hypothetical protein HQL73_01300 [Magnetococcales bacterium]|nr:hypothetical protein [Magnetococcales bacterium]